MAHSIRGIWIISLNEMIVFFSILTHVVNDITTVLHVRLVSFTLAFNVSSGSVGHPLPCHVIHFNYISLGSWASPYWNKSFRPLPLFKYCVQSVRKTDKPLTQGFLFKQSPTNRHTNSSFKLSSKLRLLKTRSTREDIIQDRRMLIWKGLILWRKVWTNSAFYQFNCS